MEYILNELLSLTDDEIKRWKDHKVKIRLSDGSTIIDYITGFNVAANTPNLICGFILKSQNISFHKITHITII